MKLLATVLLGATLLSNTAIASERAELTGSLAADLMYHCSDEMDDMSYMNKLVSVAEDFSDEEKAIMFKTGKKASFELAVSNPINLSCDLVVSLLQ